MAGTTVIYQPCYFPKLHYLARVNSADDFIIFDDVEFSRRSRQHRAEIDFHGKQWLTIPVKHTGTTLLKNAKIDNSGRWQEKHQKTLKHKYGTESSLFDEYFEASATQDDSNLIDFTTDTLFELFNQFDVETSVHWSSKIPVEHPGDPSEYLAALTEYVSGDTYLCGQGVYDGYLDTSFFDSRGIKVKTQNWDSEWEGGNVCSLDVLFNTDNPEEYIG